MVLQVELHTHEPLDKAWRRLAKRDAKQAQADSDHVPAAQQPEAVFLPQMLDEFLEVRHLLLTVLLSHDGQYAVYLLHLLLMYPEGSAFVR